MSDALIVRRDVVHRFWPVGMTVVIAAILVAVEGFTLGGAGVLATFGAVAAGCAWLFSRESITVTETSVTVKGYFFAETINFADVIEHDMSIASDSLDLGSDIGEVLLTLLMFVTVRPFRWILRMVVYRSQTDVFYRGVLVLRGYENKQLLVIEASHGWSNIVAVFERITHTLERAGSPLPQARLVER